MLGSLRSPRAPHIQPLSATIRQQAAGPCSARYARLARPISSHYQQPSGSSIPTVRHCPRPPPSRARSFLAVCVNGCAWIIIHFGFSVLDNYSFLPLRGYKREAGAKPAPSFLLRAAEGCPHFVVARLRSVAEWRGANKDRREAGAKPAPSFLLRAAEGCPFRTVTMACRG